MDFDISHQSISLVGLTLLQFQVLLLR